MANYGSSGLVDGFPITIPSSSDYDQFCPQLTGRRVFFPEGQGTLHVLRSTFQEDLCSVLHDSSADLRQSWSPWVLVGSLMVRSLGGPWVLRWDLEKGGGVRILRVTPSMSDRELYSLNPDCLPSPILISLLFQDPIDWVE